MFCSSCIVYEPQALSDKDQFNFGNIDNSHVSVW